MDRNNNELLAEYSKSGSDEPFGQLVENNVGMVFAVAWRRTCSRELAEEVCQVVFTVLARKASRLANHPSISAWLHKTTALEAAKIMRRERNHRKKLQKLAERRSLDASASESPQTLEHLDDAIASLRPADRDFLFLRFYEGRQLDEIASLLGKSGSATRKQSQRVLARLREALSKRGIAFSSGALGGLFAAAYQSSAPREVAAEVATAGPAAVSVSTFGLITNTVQTMFYLKHIVASTTAIVVAAALPVVIYSQGSKKTDAGSRNSQHRIKVSGSRSTERIETLFQEMKEGRFRRASFPSLKWDDIGALVEHVDSQTELKTFPTNPLSSQSQDSCREGIVAMWLIDGIRCGNLFPGLNPVLSSVEPRSDESTQTVAADAFKRWWRRVQDWPANEARVLSPLRGSALSWYGNATSIRAVADPETAVVNAAYCRKLVSVSDDGSFYFQMDRFSEERKIGGSMYRVGFLNDELLWTTTHAHSPLVFALRDGMLLELSKWFVVRGAKAAADKDFVITFFRDGKRVRTHSLSTLVGASSIYKPGSFRFNYEDSGKVWVSFKCTGYGAEEQHALEFDLASGALTRLIDAG